MGAANGTADGTSEEKVEKIAGVELVDSILVATQAGFFASAVADPRGIGHLWPIVF